MEWERMNMDEHELGAGEMAQQLRALTALPEDPDLLLSTNMVAYNFL